MAFESIRVPQVAASLGISVAVAAVDGGPDSYWHRRADGSDALAMLLREFVPLVRARVVQAADFSQTETCVRLSVVKGSLCQPAQR
jgi:hypothetical protein